MIKLLIFNFLICAVGAFAFAQTEPPQFVTVDGRLYNSTNPTDPLLDANVAMRIQVLNPAKTCILYEEQQSVSTLANGFFNARVGSPTSGMDSLKRTALDSGNAMSLVFQNQNLPIAGQTSGGLGCSYTPAPGESRFFRFIVTPSTTGVTSTLSPDMTIDSVPQSLVAETLQGFASDDFLQINANVTQAKANSLFGGSYAALTSLLSGTSSLYLRNTAGGTVIPSSPVDPGTLAAGQMWYDSTTNELKYYNGTVVQTVGAGLDATKLPLAGGTMAGAIVMGSNDITSVGHITQSAQRTFRFGGYTAGQQTTLLTTPPLGVGHQGTTWYNTDTDKVMYWDGVAAQELLTSTSANSLVPNCNANESLQMSPGPTYVWSCVPTTDSTKLALAGGALTGALTMNAQNQVRYADADSSNYAAVQAPTTISSDYILTLPVDNGTPGQVLQTDGNGILSWLTIPTAPVTSVFGRTGVVVAATSDYDANQIDNTPAGTISATDVQTAINELDTEKAITTRNIGTAANSGLAGGGNLSADRNLVVDITGTTALGAAADNADEVLIYDTSGTVLRKVTRAQLNLSESEVDAFVANNGYALATNYVAKAGDMMTGALNLDNEQELRLSEADGSGVNYVALKSPTTLGANYTLTLPVDDGTSGQVLSTDGNGILSWVSSIAPDADSLDFTHFADAMTLDASTDISVTGTQVLSVTNTGTGNSFRVNDQAGDTNPFVIDAAGSVGIGTTVPNAPLDVGGYGAPQLAVNPSALFTSNADAISGIEMKNTHAGTSAEYRFLVYNNNNTNAISFTQPSTGNTATLFGLTRSTGSFIFNNGTVGRELAIGPVTSNSLVFGTNNLERARISSTGSFGIGTTVPGTLLDVAGAITSRPNGTGTGQTGQIIMRELAAGGSETATIRAPDAIGASYALTLPVDDGTSGQVLSTDGNGVLSWIAAGSTITADSLNFTDLADALVLDASTDISATGTNALSITNSGTGSSLRVNDEAGDTTPFVIDDTGKVGIGTTTPAQALSVVGRVSAAPSGVTPDDTYHGNLVVTKPAASGQYINLIRSSSFAWSLGMNYNTTTFAIGQGAATDSNFNNPYFSIDPVSSLTTVRGGFRSYVNATGDVSISHAGFVSTMQAAPTVQLALGSNGAEVVRLDSSGNVGIGTTIPGAALDVQRATTTLAQFGTADGDGSGARIWQSLDDGMFSLRDSFGAEDVRFASHGGTGQDSWFNGGRLGIGTTVPGTLLDVAGAITSRPFGAATGETGQFVMRELGVNGTNTATIRAPDALGSNYALTLPVDDGTSGQVLSTDGNGVLSWIAAGGSIAADSLNFTDLADALVLDASTDISATGTNALSITNSGTADSFRVNDASSDTSPFVIDASGNVGIGTSSASSPLTINQGDVTNLQAVRILNTGAGATGIRIDRASGGYLEIGNQGASSFSMTSTNRSLLFAVDNNIFDVATPHAFGFANASVAARKVMALQGAAGQTANIFETQTDTGSVLTSITASGGATFTSNVGIGTTVPGTLLDVAGAITSRPYGANTGETGQLILRELAANGTSTATIRAPDALGGNYVLTLPADDGSAGQVLSTDGNGVLSWIAGGGTPAADSINFTELADALVLDASTDISATGTNVLSITNTGTGASFQVNDDTGDTSPFIITDTGNVGLGTTTPVTKLEVNGQIKGTFVSHSSLNTDWLSGNIQSTSVAAGTLTFTSGSMFDGANYTLILTSAGTFTLSTTGDITTWRCMPACGSNQIVTTGHTVLTIIKAGTTGYVSWIAGF